MPLRHFLLIAVLSGSVPAFAVAQTTGVNLGQLQTDPNAPVDVTSDQLDLSQAEGTALFSGNVVVTQADMKLTAPQILVTYTRLPDGTVGKEVDTIHATGGVLVVTPTEAAEADEAVFTPIRNEVVMTGSVLLTQGPNTVAGQRLVYDLTTGIGKVDGRVRTLMQSGGAPK